MPDVKNTDPLHKRKGFPKKPQQKTSNPIKSQLTGNKIDGYKPSERRQTQEHLRQLMENAAEEVITLMTGAILSGMLKDPKTGELKEISNTMRLDLMKSFMPYVLPQLKSVEYIEAKPQDLQPLVINMNGGKASISMTSGNGKGKEDTKTEVTLEDNNNNEENKGPKLVN